MLGRQADEHAEQAGVPQGEADYYDQAGLRMMADLAALRRRTGQHGWGKG